MFIVILTDSRYTDIHAFVAWFDILFACTHKKTKFSTGPHAQYTHWKYVPHQCFSYISSSCAGRQTVFYTPSTILVNAGDTIKGSLSCAPNQRNNRDLDISFRYTTPRDSEVRMDYKMCVVLAPDVLLFVVLLVNER